MGRSIDMKLKITTKKETEGYFIPNNPVESSLGYLVRMGDSLYVITEVFPFGNGAIIEKLPKEEQIYPVNEPCYVLNEKDFNITQL
jgi:hypothetical protein